MNEETTTPSNIKYALAEPADERGPGLVRPERYDTREEAEAALEDGYVIIEISVP